mmetsp:Transcript_20665/g.37552  ORF Transcript_20665/g.37552 Transcript_20665/m.37552 type:complete len:95 (+) Transcript_20665:95-379(+)
MIELGAVATDPRMLSSHLFVRSVHRYSSGQVHASPGTTQGMILFFAGHCAQDCEEQELPPFDSMNIMKLLHKQVAAGGGSVLFWKIHQNERSAW